MRITETFLSLQGESSSSGAPTFFIRTSGCNLRCSWCDTRYSFYGGEEQSLDHLLEQTRASGAKQICLTGGEPLMEEEAPELCRRLLDEGFSVQVETGGHMDTSVLPRDVCRVADLKAPSSGECGSFLWSNLQDLRAGDDLKLVIADREDLDWALKTLDEHQAWGPHQVWLSPAADLIQADQLAAWMLEYPDRPWRLQVQLHKVLWGNRRGK